MPHQGNWVISNAYRSYQTCVSDAAEDPDWDAFLLKTPGGHYTQTSLWAQAKTFLGWRAVRIVISQKDHIVAGTQLVTLPSPRRGWASRRDRSRR